MRMAVLALSVSALMFGGAATVDAAISQEVFNAEAVPIGSLVSLTNGDPRQVSLADVSNGDYLFGVVTQEGTSLAELGSRETGQPVVTSGDVSVIVSTINGEIAKGDILGISNVRGVAAKASAAQGTTTIGVALSDFSATSTTARVVSSTQESGATDSIVVGTVPVRLAVNDFYIESAANSSVLTSFGEQLIGRPVSQVKAFLAAGLVLASVLVGGLIIWNAVRGSFISIGRNPLSSSAVFNGLFYVTLVSIAVIVAGFAAGYVVLII